jgi:D-3-phosphoglycerate dehydrogenase
MKILVTPTSFGPDSRHAAKVALETFASEIIYNPCGRPLEENEIIDLLPEVEGYIAGLDHITAKVVRCAPSSLKVISRYGSGLDRVDLKAAGKRGIVVTNTPHANAEAVADLTFGLILGVARGIPFLDREVRRGKWPRQIGCELYRKRLGIIGLGMIGKKVALRAAGFSMRIMAYDPLIDEGFAKQNGIEVVTLPKLFRDSDLITLHLPLDDRTRHLIDSKRIAAMKDGVMIINTARFELFKEDDILAGLKSGKIGGIGLDVYGEEPPRNLPFSGFDNVVYTPHCGAHTTEAIARMAQAAVDNLIAVLTHRPCAHIVNQRYLTAR